MYYGRTLITLVMVLALIAGAGLVSAQEGTANTSTACEEAERSNSSAGFAGGATVENLSTSSDSLSIGKLDELGGITLGSIRATGGVENISGTADIPNKNPAGLYVDPETLKLNPDDLPDAELPAFAILDLFENADVC